MIKGKHILGLKKKLITKTRKKIVYRQFRQFSFISLLHKREPFFPSPYDSPTCVIASSLQVASRHWSPPTREDRRHSRKIEGEEKRRAGSVGRRFVFDLENVLTLGKIVFPPFLPAHVLPLCSHLCSIHRKFLEKTGWTEGLFYILGGDYNCWGTRFR